MQVENALFAHDAVREVAVVAVPCDVHGEQVAAVVVLHPPSHPSRRPGSPAPPPSEDVLREVARGLLPRHAVPALVVCLSDDEAASGDGLPKNATGKVVKAEVKLLALREWEKRGLGKKGPRGQMEAVRAKL